VRRRFEERFTATRMAKDYLRVYKSLLARSNVKLVPDPVEPMHTPTELDNEPSASVH
jgi:hypothetical protein